MSKDSQILANRSLGEILSSGFQLFGQTYLKIIGPLVLFCLLYIILSIVLVAPLYTMTYNYYISQQSFLDWYSNLPLETVYSPDFRLSSGQEEVILTYLMHKSVIGFFTGIIGGIFTAIAMCSVSSYLITTYHKGTADLSTEMKISLGNPNIIKVILFGAGISALYGVSGLSTLTLMLIIPVILIFCYYVFMVFTFSLKDVNNPAKEARLIASGQSMRIIGVFVVVELITGLIQTVMVFIIPSLWPVTYEMYLSWFTPQSFNIGLAFLNDIIINSVVLLFSPLFICLLTPLFVSSKARKDIGYKYQREQHVAWGSQRQQQQQPASGSARYGASKGSYASARKQRPWEQKVAATRTTSSGQKQRRGGLYCPFCGIHVKSPKKYCPGCGEDIGLDVK